MFESDLNVCVGVSACVCVCVIRSFFFQVRNQLACRTWKRLVVAQSSNWLERFELVWSGWFLLLLFFFLPIYSLQWLKIFELFEIRLLCLVISLCPSTIFGHTLGQRITLDFDLGKSKQSAMCERLPDCLFCCIVVPFKFFPWTLTSCVCLSTSGPYQSAL